MNIYIFFFGYIFLFTYLLHTQLISLLREIAKSSINNDRILTFSFKKLINAGNIHKILQDKKLYEQYLILMHLASYFNFTQKNIFIMTENHTYFN